MPSTPDLVCLNAELEPKTLDYIIAWTGETFWLDIAMSSSLPMQNLPHRDGRISDSIRRRFSLPSACLTSRRRLLTQPLFQKLWP